jgi:pSer/pThr/pTyr-binding forkhead associated (FHA) protein
MEPVNLEIVEGNGAGSGFSLETALVIGRGSDAGIRIDDARVSRLHARLRPTGDGAGVIEDLGSRNGTFVNGQPIYDPVAVHPGDTIQLGVTVFTVRTARQAATNESSVRPIPAAFSRPAEPLPAEPVEPEAVLRRAPDFSEIDRLLDVNIKRQARTAPLALFVLVALALIIFLAVRR